MKILTEKKKDINKRKEGTFKFLQKSYFVNKKNWTSRSTSNTSNSNFNVTIPQWSEAISIEEEDVGICKCRRKFNVDIIHEEVKGISSKMEEIKLRKCSRKNHIDIINEETKGSSSEEEDIEMCKWSRISRVDTIN